MQLTYSFSIHISVCMAGVGLVVKSIGAPSTPFVGEESMKLCATHADKLRQLHNCHSVCTRDSRALRAYLAYEFGSVLLCKPMASDTVWGMVSWVIIIGSCVSTRITFTHSWHTVPRIFVASSYKYPLCQHIVSCIPWLIHTRQRKASHRNATQHGTTQHCT